MTDEEEHLLLKWGSLKGWFIGAPPNEKMGEALQRWIDSGVSYSAMRRNTPEQAVMICEIIDACNGEIWNDWDGVIMTKEAAKDYVMNYGKAPTEAERKGPADVGAASSEQSDQ